MRRSSTGSTRCWRKMTTTEKLQQVQLLSDGQITDADAKAGVGGVFSLTDPAKINHFQHVAVEQSRLHIPILFAYDTIHGYRTVFPHPARRGEFVRPGCGAYDDAPFGARETAAVGIKQVYSPMVDVSHEPRWGRIAEGNGEDPYLGSVMGAARVRGDQGSELHRARQGGGERQALRRLRPARGRARLQHDRHVRAAAAQPLPAAVQGRGRRRRRHRDVLVQRHQRRARAARTPRPRPTSSSRSGASTASSRATTRPSTRCGPARPRRPTAARAATAWRPTARRPAPSRSTPAPTWRW